MRIFRTTLPLFCIVAALVIAGCSSSKKKKVTDEGTYQPEEVQQASDDCDVGGDSDSSRACALRTVYFPFDSAALTSASRESLDNNAKYLKENSSVELQVEGHCDERGGTEYNIALGQRRANSVRDYLTALGVSGSRISTVSFGKERPISIGHDEDAWAKNRRTNFVLTSK